MLALSTAARAKHNVDRVTKLLVSSAPARHDTKLAIMDHFRNSGLFELYGSTEAGLVTMLHPEKQFTKLGSVGRECVGSAPIRLLDPAGKEVADGETGELYSCNPYTFDGYWKLPDKTAEAFRGDYCTVGDLARRDQDGFYYLVDRKSNMIISGGENIYPSEVENLLGSHSHVKEVAVIGVPDPKWGERVHAVVVPHAGRRSDAKNEEMRSNADLSRGKNMNAKTRGARAMGEAKRRRKVRAMDIDNDPPMTREAVGKIHRRSACGPTETKTSRSRNEPVEVGGRR
jgi:fatty-acyl-CoA synthase